MSQQEFNEKEEDLKKEPLVPHTVEKPIDYSVEQTGKTQDKSFLFLKSSDLFLTELEKITDDEEKLTKILNSMEQALSAEIPDFKFFWDIRKLVFPYLKKQINPTLRLQIWEKLNDLAKESRRLKAIWDEQSDFAAEQIDIAIQALENQLIEKPKQLIELPNIESRLESKKELKSQESSFLKADYTIYESIQKELDFLNIQAARINSLRKELIKTGMRIKTKNKFFHRLSKMGDLIFPLRKELVKNISESFQKDVEQFIEEHFRRLHEPSYILREEIKVLQNMAKLFTLNSQVFSYTRLKLSECWDQLKESEKLRKKEFSHKKEIFKQNFEDLQKAFNELEQVADEAKKSPQEISQELDQILATMRIKELGREDVQELKILANAIRKKVQQLFQTAENLKKEEENIKLQQKKEYYQKFITNQEAFFKECDHLTIEEILAKKESLLTELKNSSLTKLEKNELEKKLQGTKEIIQKKKEQVLLNLPSDKKQALEQLYELIEQKQQQRQELKIALKECKKSAGVSGLDFEKAISYTNTINEIQQKLAESETNLQELEEKISDLEEKHI